ncbi:MAG: UDP-N-acetylglucosamine 2-epimerase (non-hydrolyzing) [Candidatus Bathyarchaeota archaeon]|nr:UDP-N-acetylglucosamine 2-epimerase (non-hydrolyzing) [Candidatus Bathyarchaeota archaeon]
MKLILILGTRPEILKCSSLIRECERLGLDYCVLHTGQHYSYSMDKVFFDQLDLPQPKYHLDVGSGSHGEQTGKMLIGISQILAQDAPDVALVQGDTNTTFAGAVASSKLSIKVGHVEAGLRSYDRQMPEEINRVLADHCSDFLFAPTEQCRQTLLGEGIGDEKLFVTDNTVVDAVNQNLAISAKKTQIMEQLSLTDNGFVLVTVHRQENVDNPKRFAGIIEGFQKVQRELNVPLVYPVHPRAKKQMGKFGLDVRELTLIEPLDYFAFLQLESKAKLVLTDSGGVQEEACILGVPCVTVRDNTERPETLEVGSNILAGTNPDRILEAAKASSAKNRNWLNPFGDGKTGQRIIGIISEVEH